MGLLAEPEPDCSVGVASCFWNHGLSLHYCEIRQLSEFSVTNDRDQADELPFLSPIPFHPFPKLAAVTPMLSWNLWMIWVALRPHCWSQEEWLEERLVCIELFFQQKLFLLCFFLVPSSILPYFWHLETYVFEVTYKQGQPLYNSSILSKPSS